jgi:TonB family protein
MSENSQATEGVPSSIGRYQITGTLGFGAMGAVYRAFDPIIKRPLAIKTIRLDVPPQSPQHRGFIDRFYQEARISGTLSHPNIVTLFDIGEEKGVPFLAMEYVEGRTIAELLESGERFRPERVLGLVSQVASALDYAHSQGIIHRDIKPSNLIVQEGDRLKVTDFGIAKAVDSEITQTGALLGTPSYMSPEQAMGETLDGRSDLFSLGVVAFEMLSGQQPFPGTNVTSILYRLVHVDPIEPADLEMNGLIPQKWREVFHRVLAKKPEARYPKASDFVQDLEYCLGTWFTGLGEETVALETPAAAEATVTLSPTLPAAEPAPAAESPTPPEPAPAAEAVTAEERTVVLASTTEALGPDGSATLRLDRGAPSEPGEETVALPSATSPPGSAAGATVVLGTPPSTTLTQPAARSAPDLGPAPPAGSRRRSLPAGALVVASATVFLLAAATVVWLLWQRSHAPAGETSPPPVAAVPPDAPPPLPPPTGALRVESVPPGAQVTVNGEARGRTPLDLGALPFGAYEVRIDRRGYEPQRLRVALSAENPRGELSLTLERRAPSRGTADFVSTPPGAAVTVDGRRLGKAPLSGVSLTEGRHPVEMSLDGHQAWSGTVEVVAGRRVRAAATLTPIHRAESRAPSPPPVDTSRVYENRLGKVDRLARRTSGTSPSYPDRAPRLRSGERVSVTLSFVITETGGVEDLKVVGSAGKLIDDVVVRAVETWRYEPAEIRGTPVRVRVLFKQTFLGG